MPLYILSAGRDEERVRVIAVVRVAPMIRRSRTEASTTALVHHLGAVSFLTRESRALFVLFFSLPRAFRASSVAISGKKTTLALRAYYTYVAGVYLAEEVSRPPITQENKLRADLCVRCCRRRRAKELLVFAVDFACMHVAWPSVAPLLSAYESSCVYVKHISASFPSVNP